MADAANVLTLVQNLISSKLTRHITRRELIVREREVAGQMALEREGLVPDGVEGGLDGVRRQRRTAAGCGERRKGL